LNESSWTARGRLSSVERKLRRILHVLETQGSASAPRPPTGVAPAANSGAAPSEGPLAELEPDFDSAGFNERFRGTEDVIRERQRAYVPYFEGRSGILDVVCGRG